MPTPAKFTASLCFALLMFLAGYMANRQQAPVSAASEKQVLHYTCPMHPNYRSDRPGNAPCCGMRLKPVYADAGSKVAEPDVSGTVQISSATQQLIGVRVDEVRRDSTSHTLRMPGRVAVDESKQYRLIAAADGWIRELGQNPAGTFVKRNQMLASYYVRDLVASQQTLVFALQTINTPQRGSATANLQLAIDSLRGLGMSDLQIEQLKENGTAASEINIYSPANGFVIARNLSPAQRFDKGTEMYRIADISRVWVLADIYERDREFVAPAAGAVVRFQGRELRARLSDSLPQFDAQSRTLKCRFEVDNPGYVFRPDMFVDVELGVNMPAGVAVPAEAVIDSGRHKTVYVERNAGLFEPRAVETGWRAGGRVEITKGLQAGERIVVSGNFLIDSESRMGFAAINAGAAPEKETRVKDPVCGMEVDPRAPGIIQSRRAEATWYFCSNQCQSTFEADTQKYIAMKPAHGRIDGARGPA
jgi:membrane fusion protein, copper/silver efflux system